MPIKRSEKSEDGFTLAELIVGMLFLAILASSLMVVFTTLISSSILSKRQSIAQTLATNQMEYLKTLPYNSLAVAGGAIPSASPLPASKNVTVNNLVYTVSTSINYVDDAFDGCASYPSQALKEQYCRNYPPPTGAPATDTNPSDYKIIHVTVTDPGNKKLAEADTQVSARVAETASSTGALFVTVIDDNGNPVSGANVQVVNSSTVPAVNVNDSTDSNGNAVFYGLAPYTAAFNYVITASKADYSTLATIAPSGTLQPTYPSQKIFTQLSSQVTLTIKPMSEYSLVLETVGTSGGALSGARIYTKGGYKRYTSTSDTSYYFDNMTPSDTRPTTDSSGLASIDNLVPGPYIFCGDSGATNCRVGSTTYYLAAAVPYSGANSLNPINVPSYLASSPPATTFAYNGNNYLQKVRLILTTSSTFPRVQTISPSEASLSAGLTSFAFNLTGVNLPCSSSAASCSTTVNFRQGSNTFVASCTGSSAGLQLNCNVNLSGASTGMAALTVISGGNTLDLPGSPLLGGINVIP